MSKVKIHCSSCEKVGFAQQGNCTDLEGEVFDHYFYLPSGWIEACGGYQGYYCSEECYQKFLRKGNP